MHPIWRLSLAFAAPRAALREERGREKLKSGGMGVGQYGLGFGGL